MTPSPDPPHESAARRLLDAARMSPPGVGESIGPYHLVEEIGRGGHSAVFRAVQSSPVRREVAVKVLVDPAPSSNVAARFARERAVVARLRHPGIVPLIDAGEVGPAGAAVSWFAMPLVDGESADRWCDRHAAPRAVRLRVLELASRAVAAAHALGVVHRDLKPGNIMVAGAVDDPQVHVIDFGVAKLLDPDLDSGLDSGDALATRVGGIVGTPEFMSPEQANLDTARIGPACDVYALGLVGCVLLGAGIPGARAGSTDARAPMGERLRAAADREVPMVSAITADRTLRGEVEWIIAKACARDIDARYANAGALADDLARLREGQPIVAAPKDSGYAVTFAMRKHRGQLIVGTLALAAVVVGLWRNASAERQRADREHARNEQLAKALERARVQLTPLSGRNRGDRVDHAQAVVLAETMHEVNQAALGDDANETQQSALVLARAYDRVQRFADGERMFRSLLARAESDPQRLGDRAYIRLMVGGNLRRQGAARAAEALGYLTAALDYWNALEVQPPSRNDAEIEMGMVLDLLGRPDEARPWLVRAIEHFTALLGEGHTRTREARGFLADHERAQGRHEAASALYREALRGMAVPEWPDISSPSIEQVWFDAWTGELLWMERESARREGRELDPSLAMQFEAVIERTRTRDPGHARLTRWTAP